MLAYCTCAGVGVLSQKHMAKVNVGKGFCPDGPNGLPYYSSFVCRRVITRLQYELSLG